MNKKIGIRFGLLLIFCMLLCLPVRAEESDTYGDDAYYYMNYLQSNFPARAVAYPNLDAAAQWLKERVSEMGYQYAGQPFSVPYGEYIINGENIIFSKPGQSSQVIVVGAHYDSVETNGTDDNATGVGLLLELANRLSAGETPPYTVRFVLFSAEEPGCFGSQYYVDSLSEEERQNIICMINIDTIGAGDNMYLYGGGLDNSGNIVRSWVVEQALSMAQNMSLAMSYHPDVNPEFPVPVKHTASDQQAFDRAGIPYLYLEASNWNGGPYTNFYQTDNPAVENGKMMHVAQYENLEFYNQTFGNRIYQHLKAYSKLIYSFLYQVIPNEGSINYEFEEVNETVYAVSDVRVRRSASTFSEVLDVLREGESIIRTGYQQEWSRVLYDSQEAYIKTEYLSADTPETEETSEENPEESSEAESKEESEKESEDISQAVDFSKSEQESTTQNEIILQTAEQTQIEEVTEAMGILTQTLEEPQKREGVLDTVITQMEENPVLRLAVIAAIAVFALILCLIVFLIQHSK